MNDGQGEQMKERPILFNGEMVRAILDGRKTQTRRVIKHISPEWIPNPSMEKIYTGILESPFPWNIHLNRKHVGRFGVFVQFQSAVDDTETFFYPCPYGQSSGLLYCKETWRESWARGSEKHGYQVCIEYRATWNGNRDPENQVLDVPEMHYGGRLRDNGALAWRPSIFMPKKATRLWLRVNDIRVERVQDISDQDCVDEGLYREWDDTGRGWYGISKDDEHLITVPRPAFRLLWDSINAKRGYSWESNPFCWVVVFEKENRGSINGEQA